MKVNWTFYKTEDTTYVRVMVNDVETFAEFPWNSLSKPDGFEIHDRTQKYPHVSITTKAESKLISKQENRNNLVGNPRRDYSLPIDITVIKMFNFT